MAGKKRKKKRVRKSRTDVKTTMKQISAKQMSTGSFSPKTFRENNRIGKQFMFSTLTKELENPLISGRTE